MEEKKNAEKWKEVIREKRGTKLTTEIHVGRGNETPQQFIFFRGLMNEMFLNSKIL